MRGAVQQIGWEGEISLFKETRKHAADIQLEVRGPPPACPNCPLLTEGTKSGWSLRCRVPEHTSSMKSAGFSFSTMWKPMELK